MKRMLKNIVTELFRASLQRRLRKQDDFEDEVDFDSMAWDLASAVLEAAHALDWQNNDAHARKFLRSLSAYYEVLGPVDEFLKIDRALRRVKAGESDARTEVAPFVEEFLDDVRRVKNTIHLAGAPTEQYARALYAALSRLDPTHPLLREYGDWFFK